MDLTHATTALPADHGWHGPWFLLFPFFWPAFLLAVLVVLRRTVWRRAGYRGCAGGGPESPLAVDRRPAVSTGSPAGR